MSNIKKLMMSAAGGGAGLDVDEVFSTYLYTGDYNTGELNQHIKNNISLGSLGSGGSSVNFSGNQYLTRSDFSGNSDGKELTFSAWILFNDFENNFVFSSDPNGGGSGINVGYFSGKLRFYAYNSGGSVVSEWHVDDSNTPFHQWFHLCFSVNTASGTGATKVYINDVAATKESVTSSNQNIDRTRTVQRIAARGTDYELTGNLAHVFMDYTYRDLDTESNRRLFIDANGGSTDPSTLSALNPIMYCPLTDDYTMGKNLGTGGDFTSSGGPSFSSLGTEATDDASGGMVWIKNRSSTDSHMLFDTERGSSKSLSSNDTTAEVTNNPDTLTQFLADGFFLGDDVAVNTNNEDYASWTFGKAPKFFDIVTYTGNGPSNTQNISHNLGSAPGMLVVRARSVVSNWHVWHRGFGDNGYIMLNASNAKSTYADLWDDTAPTATHFTVSEDNNTNGVTYVAYLFAHNDGDGEFGPDGGQDIIKCGSYTGNSSVQDIDLGFEAQWVLVKNITSGNVTAARWGIYDVMRGMPPTTYGAAELNSDQATAERTGYSSITPHANGFTLLNGVTMNNQSNNDYIYMAIRRGPLAPPESATEVFEPDFFGPSSAAPAWQTTFPVDLAMWTARSGNLDSYIGSRLQQGRHLTTHSTRSEISDTAWKFDYMNGFYNSYSATQLTDYIAWMWKRAPGFFDVVAYSGNSTDGRTVSHNLGVTPEMMWVKRRDSYHGAQAWVVYHKNLDATNPAHKYLRLNDSEGVLDSDGKWYDTAPTDSVFTVANNTDINNSNGKYIAYLFATLSGISKVGSYTGNGSSQTINCGFTSGARFILIKRLAANSDWYIWDTKRGIVAGNDPHLSLNTTAAEVTSDDSIDPDNSGFIVNQVSATNINVSSATYIFYAIA